MKQIKIIITFISLFSIQFSIAQNKDPDYIKYKNQGDFCFKKKDYTCAKREYNYALAIANKDSYCNQMLLKIAKEEKSIETERKAKLKEKKELSKINSQPYFGSLFFLKDDNSDIYCYNGLILNDLPNGKGTVTFAKKGNVDAHGFYQSNATYVGEFVNGNLFGIGEKSWEKVLKSSNNDIYKGRSYNYLGEFHKSQMNGDGKLISNLDGESKEIYEGLFLDDEFVSGKYNNVSNGSFYIGTMQKWNYDGFGVLEFNPNISDENFENNLEKGTIIENCPNAIKFKGIWKEGLKINGKCYDKVGKLIYDGDFVDDEPKGEYSNRK